MNFLSILLAMSFAVLTSFAGIAIHNQFDRTYLRIESEASLKNSISYEVGQAIVKATVNGKVFDDLVSANATATLPNLADATFVKNYFGIQLDSSVLARNVMRPIHYTIKAFNIDANGAPSEAVPNSTRLADVSFITFEVNTADSSSSSLSQVTVRYVLSR